MDGHYRNKQVSGYSTYERRKTNKNSKVKVVENALKKNAQEVTQKISTNHNFFK